MNGQIVSHEGHETHGLAVKNSNFNQNPSFQNRPNQSKNVTIVKNMATLKIDVGISIPILDPKFGKEMIKIKNLKKTMKKTEVLLLLLKRKGLMG